MFLRDRFRVSCRYWKTNTRDTLHTSDTSDPHIMNVSLEEDAFKYRYVEVGCERSKGVLITWFWGVLELAGNKVHQSVHFFLVCITLVAPPDSASNSLGRARVVSGESVVFTLKYTDDLSDVKCLLVFIHTHQSRSKCARTRVGQYTVLFLCASQVGGSNPGHHLCLCFVFGYSFVILFFPRNVLAICFCLLFSNSH